MTEQANEPDDLGQPDVALSDDQDSEPGSVPTGAAAQEPETGDQDAGPASEPQEQ